MLRISALAVVLVAAGCGGQSYPYPAKLTDYFGATTLVRATNWTREGTSAAVYIREGESMPSADLQIGVIVSYDKPTARELYGWIEFAGAPSRERYYHSGEHNEWCTVARSRNPEQPRLYASLIVCQDGIDRAVCVEADERIDEDEAGGCIGSMGCSAVCDRQWSRYGEELDWLIADILRNR